MADVVMYDSVTVGAIPANAFAVAGYVNGRYLTWPVLRRRIRTRADSPSPSRPTMTPTVLMSSGGMRHRMRLRRG